MSILANSYLVLNSKEFELPYHFKMIEDISCDISESLQNDDHKYVIKSQVSEDILQLFIRYLVEGEEPEIHFDTIYELSQLSHEFQIDELNSMISAKRKKWREVETYIENQAISPQTEKQDDTKEQIQKLELHINQLHRILNSQKSQIEKLKKQVKNKDADQQDDEKDIKNTDGNQEDTDDYDDYDTNKEPFINSNIELLTMNQNSMLNENIKNQQSEMMEQIRIIKEEIRLKEAELRKQEKTNLDHYNSIEKLKIQVEGFNKQLNLQKELITQTENSLNAKLEQIKHANDKLIAEFITKSISNKYLFKSNSNIIFWFNIIPTVSF
ncbi:hypothetical protein M9Y10_031139 [Tritrichomonas musculus]|uniref:Uncharacterized protein n=1 Tax=Tritrichomonas musculus TaxID=1915356 RepID=A0ABR2H208_9EUKA